VPSHAEHTPLLQIPLAHSASTAQRSPVRSVPAATHAGVIERMNELGSWMPQTSPASHAGADGLQPTHALTVPRNELASGTLRHSPFSQSSF